MSGPTLGADVLYRTDGRGGLDYYLPAKVVVTAESADARGPLDVPRRGHAHLRVFSPGNDYVEFNVSHGTEPGQWLYPYEYERIQDERGVCASPVDANVCTPNGRAYMGESSERPLRERVRF